MGFRRSNGTYSLAEEFEDRSLAIRRRFKLAEHHESHSPYASARGAFKREAYALIRKLKDAPGRHRAIKRILTDNGIEPARLYYSGNEFHFGLLALDPGLEILDKKNISRFARQMTYADLHGVPEHYLIGFLYQSGSTAAITTKLDAKTREPWFGGGSV